MKRPRETKPPGQASPVGRRGQPGEPRRLEASAETFGRFVRTLAQLEAGRRTSGKASEAVR